MLYVVYLARILFIDYTKSISILVVIVYFISKKFISNSNLVDKKLKLVVTLDIKVERKSIENSLPNTLLL